MAFKIEEPDLARQAKVLLYDIENMGILGWTFGPTYEANILHIEHYPHLLTFAWKWLGEPRTHVLGLDDFKLHKKDKCNDIELVKRLHALQDEADVVIGHNSRQFDDKMVNARYMYHRLGPVSPFTSLDTKTLAKRYNRFTSNSLDNIGDFMGLGRKVKHGDFEQLWLGCERGDLKAYKAMKKYNKKDVKLLEEWYLELRPYIQGHPSISLIENRINDCPKCGQGPMVRAGLYFTKVSKVINYRCNYCGGYSKQRMSIKSAVHFTN